MIKCINIEYNNKRNHIKYEWLQSSTLIDLINNNYKLTDPQPYNISLNSLIRWLSSKIPIESRCKEYPIDDILWDGAITMRK